MDDRRQTARPDGPYEETGEVWDDPDLLYAAVLRALDQGRAREALPAAERLRDIDDDAQRAVLAHALVLRACAEHARAENVLIRHIRARGGSADTWFALAPLASWRGSDRDVATALDNALRHDPDHPDALEWGYKYRLREEGPQAAAQWVAERSERSWRARIILGELELRGGDTQTALDLFETACRSAPSEPGPLAAAARILAAEGHDAICAALVRRHWTGSRGPLPLIEAIEADLRLGRPGDAALALARLRGLEIPQELVAVVADVRRRVEAACAARGL
ncbi:tetratricopeptide repeat protein [Marinactinospora thermotolerans]|uniref:Tetratricopeptide repeat-containing protein n=1 Tax=Marinactinospora thermotolerans DSM 45154 TaxID=1122192 RepID=A0A1T4QIL3_9ACTN|nr:hypothetical protein [Marinactinospora thermotolerans]SKA03486.1 hypothetical protein SAMN02745673_02250 [Marinactinospora thermotolerans DSM 45154]